MVVTGPEPPELSPWITEGGPSQPAASGQHRLWLHALLPPEAATAEASRSEALSLEAITVTAGEAVTSPGDGLDTMEFWEDER